VLSCEERVAGSSEFRMMRCVSILFSMRQDQIRSHQVIADTTYRDDSLDTDTELDITIGKTMHAVIHISHQSTRPLALFSSSRKHRHPFTVDPLDRTLELYALDCEKLISNFC
jgi:hypothetical protein